MTKTSNDYINEFLAEFAKAGIVFTEEQINVMFRFHTSKLSNLIGELEDEKSNTDRV